VTLNSSQPTSRNSVAKSQTELYQWQQVVSVVYSVIEFNAIKSKHCTLLSLELWSSAIYYICASDSYGITCDNFNGQTTHLHCISESDMVLFGFPCAISLLFNGGLRDSFEVLVSAVVWRFLTPKWFR